ncbi:MAG: cytochrome C552 [Gammaproteobacteria bacterium]
MNAKLFTISGLTVVLTAGLVAGLIAGQTLAAGSAEVRTINLPPDTSRLRSSTLPGYNLALQKCGICHSADYISFQAPGLTQAQWTAEVGKMQHTYGAPLSDDEVKSIGAYLAVAYGSAKATDASIIAASSAPAPAGNATKAGTEIDVQALLDNHACLGCHAVDEKIVGPAFQDVAKRYKGQANALASVATSIQEGGTGKWGPVAMPHSTNLTDAEASALAEFVLKQ